jgi:hypothetical protein
MNVAEFSQRFETRFSQINSNLAYGLNDYEKSMYLTTAQEQILSNYFNPKGNKYAEGFDMSEKRHIDFSSVTNTVSLSTENGGTPFTDNGLIFRIDDDVLFILNERFLYQTQDEIDVLTSVFPIEYKDLERILSKAYTSPPKRQSWRIVKGGNISGNIIVEIIPKSNIDKTKPFTYTARYIKRPTPIIVGTLSSPLQIGGLTAITECALPPEIHDEILDRAIEICRVDYAGDYAGMLQLDQRNE